ncbi:MAG TPA: DNA replication and repair protein RecF [Thermoleophilaceae bacterium]|nr:DNA replication and repair protein RecF [Thermoleophilaceae bacterium]
MRVTAVTLRDFRNYACAEVALGDCLTVVVGPNGAGKSNLLEALYFGCTARSPRTSNERELVRRGAHVARVTVSTVGEDGEDNLLEVGFAPGEPKSLKVNGAAVETLATTPARPLLSVFFPERLELVKGAPGARRAHLDRLVAAMWPARAATRSAYSRALAQRNALLGRIRGGAGSADSLASWDAELARHGWRLMADRAETLTRLGPLFSERARELGLPAESSLRYRPRSQASDPEELAAELRERHAADLERGFTAHGPHRDDVSLLHADLPLRTYGSQGQQRVGLLALLFAERDLLATERDRPPLMLFDDVMSELDESRRELLSELLRSAGQSLITTTDLHQVPGSAAAGVTVVEVTAGKPRAIESPEVAA